jgi:Domain of unknown function (DUF4258)
MIRFDPHAEFQIERRGISRSWIDETLRSWDETETRGGKRSFLKCYPERGKKLRVVVRENDLNMSLLPISTGGNHALKN